jgi:preprotein translocase subunit SecG
VHIIVTVLHVFICLALILTVLLQAGKGADMGAAFGGSSQTVFGSSGPGTFLGKMTTFIAIAFMLTSLWLAYAAFHKGGIVIEGPPAVEQQATETQKSEVSPPQKPVSSSETKGEKSD